MPVRPIANLTFAINYAIAGLDLPGLHVGNLRPISSRRCCSSASSAAPCFSRRSGNATAGAAPALAAAVAAIWVAHPLETEAVTYIVQRVESLAGLFYCLTLYCVIRGASSKHPGGWHACAVCACALGIGAKEIVATAPVVALLYDRCFLSGEVPPRPLFPAGCASTSASPQPGWSSGFFSWPTPGARLQAPASVSAPSPPGSISARSRRSFCTTCGSASIRTRSAWDYLWPIATDPRQIALTGLAVLALLAATLWALRRVPAAGFLGAWFFLILAPTSSFMPIMDPRDEHRMYLPLAAVVAAAVFCAYALERAARAGSRQPAGCGRSSSAARRLPSSCRSLPSWPA